MFLSILKAIPGAITLLNSIIGMWKKFKNSRADSNHVEASRKSDEIAARLESATTNEERRELLRRSHD